MVNKSVTTSKCIVCGQKTELVPGPQSNEFNEWCPICVQRYQFLLSHRDQFGTDTLDLFRQMMAIRP
jgi:hypothetical protein